MKRTIIAFAAVLWLAACQDHATKSSAATGSNDHATVASSTATPEKLGELGAKIKKSPNDAHRLLQEQGMTEESFAAAVRKVSEDPAAAKRYAEAFKQAT